MSGLDDGFDHARLGRRVGILYVLIAGSLYLAFGLLVAVVALCAGIAGAFSYAAVLSRRDARTYRAACRPDCTNSTEEVCTCRCDCDGAAHGTTS